MGSGPYPLALLPWESHEGFDRCLRAKSMWADEQRALYEKGSPRQVQFTPMSPSEVLASYLKANRKAVGILKREGASPAPFLPSLVDKRLA